MPSKCRRWRAWTSSGLTPDATAALRHTEGRAIDMDISWSGTLAIVGANGQTASIASTPRDGDNAQLQTVGAGYGVHKLATDPPHWSDDGH